jgi:geranylgeranyl reductase family protein
MNAAAPLKRIDEAEVVVVGAGPAGCACAVRLGELGHDVLLVEQHEMPRDKPCGDALSPTAVEELRALGLDDVLDRGLEIEGLRWTYDFRRSKIARVEGDRSRAPRSVPRLELDAALADVARSQARMITKRVRGLELDGDSLLGVRVQHDGGDALVGAQRVVAADGGSSAIRRRLGIARPRRSATAHARRQYFRTTRSLDPYWEMFLPVEFEGVAVAGCAWVFPVGEHRANVGLAHMRDATVADQIPAEELYEHFIGQIVSEMEPRFGQLEPEGRSASAPVALGFSPAGCQVGPTYLVGDAARMLDPLTGEGISYALIGGREVADIVHRDLTRSGPVPHAGTHLARRFPRLGQDVAYLARLSVLAVNRPQSGEETSQRPEDSMSAIRRMMATAGPTAPWWRETPIGRLMEEFGPEALEAFEAANAAALDAAETESPFFREAFAREMMAGLGPLAAAMAVLSALACTGEAGPEVIALASGLSGLTSVIWAMAEVVDRPKSRAVEAQNASILLFSNFAVARCLALMSTLPRAVLASIVRTEEDVCKGLLNQHQDRFDTMRSVERHELVSSRIAGGMGGEACASAASLSGASPEVADQLREMGRALSNAFVAGREIAELIETDSATGRPPGFNAGLGFYGLPLLTAEAPSLGRLLARGFDDGDTEELVEEVLASGGIERTVDECRRHAERARAIVAELDLVRPELFLRLADFAVECALEAARAAAGGDAELVSTA